MIDADFCTASPEGVDVGAAVYICLRLVSQTDDVLVACCAGNHLAAVCRLL